MLDHAEDLRKKISPAIPMKRRSALGQFMTPSSVARFMASLFPPASQKVCRLLDAGAGMGALSAAFLERWATEEGFQFMSAEVAAYEIDETLRRHLENTYSGYAEKLPVSFQISSGVSSGKQPAKLCWVRSGLHTLFSIRHTRRSIARRSIVRF